MWIVNCGLTRETGFVAFSQLVWGHTVSDVATTPSTPPWFRRERLYNTNCRIHKMAANLVTKNPVLVTGVTGYIGSFVAKDLLQRGYKVRGTTRDLGAAEAIEPLKRFPGADDRLELVAMDILDPVSVKQAMKNVDYCLHVASPFKLDVKNPMKELVEPAVQGTTNIIDAASEAKVKRVVQTSSSTAVVGRTKIIPKDHVLSENDWSDATLATSPYGFSKLEAERTAWKRAKEAGVEVVVVNPITVLGPLHTTRLSQSFGLLDAIVTGKFPVVPNMILDIVDVRDVARAHVEAIVRPNATGRHVLVAQPAVTAMDISKIAREVIPEFAGKTPTRDFTGPVGNALFKVIAAFQPSGTGAFLRSILNVRLNWNNSKSQKELGITYRDPKDTVADALRSMAELGLFDTVKN